MEHQWIPSEVRVETIFQLHTIRAQNSESLDASVVDFARHLPWCEIAQHLMYMRQMALMRNDCKALLCTTYILHQQVGKLEIPIYAIVLLP